jgi:iron complex outermembrane receptor protein
MWTLVKKYDLTIGGVTYRLAGTHGPILVSGDTGNPRSRIQWINTLSHGPWSTTATISRIGSFDLTDPSLGINDCAAGISVGSAGPALSNQLANGTVPPGIDCRVAAFTTVDVTSRYAISKQFSLQISVLNLFDKRAPNDWGTYGGSGRPYNRSLHSQGGIGRFFSAQATYSF